MINTITLLGEITDGQGTTYSFELVDIPVVVNNPTRRSTSGIVKQVKPVKQIKPTKQVNPVKRRRGRDAKDRESKRAWLLKYLQESRFSESFPCPPEKVVFAYNIEHMGTIPFIKYTGKVAGNDLIAFFRKGLVDRTPHISTNGRFTYGYYLKENKA